MPDFLSRTKTLLMRIRQPSQPDQSFSGKSDTSFQPDQSCSGKSGKPLSLINPAQANKTIRQTKKLCEKSSPKLARFLNYFAHLCDYIIAAFRNSCSDLLDLIYCTFCSATSLLLFTPLLSLFSLLLHFLFCTNSH